MKLKKVKKFDLTAELDRLPEWSAYGAVWKVFKSVDMRDKQPDCTADKPCLREGGYIISTGGRATYEYVQFTVSDGNAVITQGLRDAFVARLFASAPSLLRFVKRIADGDAPTLAVVAEAQALIKEIREPVHVPDRVDSTVPSFDTTERWDWFDYGEPKAAE